MRRATLVLMLAALTASLTPAPAAGARRLCEGLRPTISGRGTIRGTPGDDVILGSRRADRILAGGGDDVVCGLRGGDEIDAGEGADRMEGGPGRDTASYTHAPGAVTVDLAAGTASGMGDDELSSIENLLGSKFDDRFAGDDGANRMDGLSGNDSLDGRGGADALSGWSGDDTLTGAEGNDELVGYEGRDLLSGNDGDDELRGGEGDDVLEGGGGSDTADYFWVFDGGVTVNLTTGIASGDGIDLLVDVENARGTWDPDELTGDEGPNRLFGGGGADRVTGLAGDDVLSSGRLGDGPSTTLEGGPGDDWIVAEGRATLSGGEGDDRLTASLEGATVDGGLGTDTADYTHVFEFDMSGGVALSDIEVDLSAGVARERGCSGCPEDTLAGIENVVGEWGDDVLIGDPGANVLDGGDGSDEVTGGGGADQLMGGADDDRLFGGDGDDVLDGGEDFFDGDAGDGGAGTDTCRSVESPTGCEVVE